MVKGIVYTLSACFIWGLIFVVPTFLNEFSPLEVALGRYFFYGSMSLLFFGGICYRKLIRYPLKIWRKALWFALIANIVYYSALVLAIQYSSATITALIAGIAPVSISFYGNWKHNEGSPSKLILPAILIAAGLFIVNAEAFFDEATMPFSYEYFIGLACAFLALCTWTWFVVANSHFLKKHATINYFEWSTVLGVATFFWVMIAALISSLFIVESSIIEKYLFFSEEMQTFLVAGLILGCICSWLGSYLWNCGCNHLPISLSGQMTVFETVFGLTFVYVVEQRLPSYLECCGISLMLLAIIYSMNTFAKTIEEPIHT